MRLDRTFNTFLTCVLCPPCQAANAKMAELLQERRSAEDWHRNHKKTMENQKPDPAEIGVEQIVAGKDQVAESERAAATGSKYCIPSRRAIFVFSCFDHSK